MPINYGILQQPQAPQNTAQVFQTAPESSSGDDIMSGMKGLFGGISKGIAGGDSNASQGSTQIGSSLQSSSGGLLQNLFGQNPVSQANQAVSAAMSNSSLHALAGSILPQGMGGQNSPQSPPGGLLNNLKQPGSPQKQVALGNDSAAPNSLEQFQQQMQPKQQPTPVTPKLVGDTQAASLAAYNGKAPYEVAQSFLGDGRQSHAEVIGDFLQKSGVGKVNIQNTPWCAGFANAVLSSTGHGSTGSLAARSFLGYGKPTSNPSQGDVVVFSDLTGNNSPAHGHVGFYAGEGDKDGYIKVLGGNQSGNVSIKEYPASKVLGYRVPPSAQELQQRQMQRQQPQQGNLQQTASMNSQGTEQPQMTNTSQSYILPGSLRSSQQNQPY